MSDFITKIASEDGCYLTIGEWQSGQLVVTIHVGGMAAHAHRVYNADAHRLADWLSAHGFGAVSAPAVADDPLDDTSTDLEALQSRADTASDMLNFHRKRIENIEARIAKLEGK